MKAVCYYQYGGPEVLRVEELPIITPGDDEILIQNHASSITRADTFLRKGEPRFGRLFIGLFKPKNKCVGTGFAGTIARVGKDVTAFKVGDKVYGETLFDFGASAEYVCVNAQKGVVQPLPLGMSFEEAAPLCDGALTSYNFLVDIAKLKAGQHILINGASGALGTAAIQIAKSIGAKVTAVCSAKNKTLVKQLGADEVIDYQQEDFCHRYHTYDAIYDAIGASSFAKAKKALKQKGMYLSPVLNGALLCAVIRTSIVGKKKAKFQATGTRKPMELNRFLEQIHAIIQKGALTTVIDKVYTIDQVVAAHQYLDSGHKKGNIVLRFR